MPDREEIIDQEKFTCAHQEISEVLIIFKRMFEHRFETDDSLSLSVISLQSLGDSFELMLGSYSTTDYSELYTALQIRIQKDHSHVHSHFSIGLFRSQPVFSLMDDSQECSYCCSHRSLASTPVYSFFTGN